MTGSLRHSLGHCRVILSMSSADHRTMPGDMKSRRHTAPMQLSGRVVSGSGVLLYSVTLLVSGLLAWVHRRRVCVRYLTLERAKSTIATAFFPLPPSDPHWPKLDLVLASSPRSSIVIPVLRIMTKTHILWSVRVLALKMPTSLGLELSIRLFRRRLDSTELEYPASSTGRG